jgi:hypothetical protein
MLHASLDRALGHNAAGGTDPIRKVLDRRVPWATHDEHFSQQSFGTGPWVDQGWKLHVSATPPSAVDVLEAVLDILLTEGARFKVVNAMSLLGALNSGLLGISQIGKFLTVYPCDDAQAVRLAVALDNATRGYRGPRIPTDRAIRPGSLVHYRYGTMVRREDHDKNDNARSGLDLFDPAGRLTEDARLTYYQPPHPSIIDPFEAAGVRVAPPERGPLLNGRYLVCDALGQSPRGGVFRAIDVRAEPARVCLLKESWHHVGLDENGRDALDWAENERHILTRYAGHPALPRFYDSFELDGNRYIAIEYIEGDALDKVLWEDHAVEQGLDPDDIVTIGMATAEALAQLHEIGLVFRDFKPANTLRTPDRRYRLIDFGIAHNYRENISAPLSTGTPPYYSREQYEGEAPSPADDVFAWGAVLYHLAGGDRSFADIPKGKGLVLPFPRKPLLDVQPSFPACLAGVIDRAVAWERTNRFASMHEARDALAAAEGEIGGSRDRPWRLAELSRNRTKTHPLPVSIGPEEALHLAREVGDALCVAAEPHGGGLCWKRSFEWVERTEYSPDLYAGAAGIGLFLAELARATGEERYVDAARGAARWLAGPVWGQGRAHHGFHSGEAGVAFFFLRLADLLDTPGYVAAADLRLRRLRGATSLTVDLMYGTGGTILGLLAMHAVTGDSQFLADARTLGDELLDEAIPTQDGTGRYWEISSAAPGGPVAPHLGLLHGAAGVGLALGYLGWVTGVNDYTGAARGAAEVLLAQAVLSSVSADDCEQNCQHLSWPGHLDDTAKGLQAHCHGAGGIGQFFLWLDLLAPDPRYRHAADRAATAIAAQLENEKRAGICHGISGTGHLMLDCHQALGKQQWLAHAGDCARRLQSFRVADCIGVYTMHDKNKVSPDLMLGYAGVGSFLLRYSAAASPTDLLFGPINDALRLPNHRPTRGERVLHKQTGSNAS